MPARRSEDPALTDAEKSGEGAREHWDETARAAARPSPFQRSLPDRDNASTWSDGAPGEVAGDPSMACEDDGDPRSPSSGQDATDE